MVNDGNSNSGRYGVTASAPGKVILFGEHFVVYGTDAILCAIDRRVSITATRSPDVRIVSEMGTLECESAQRRPEEIDATLRPLYHIARESLKASDGYDGGITLNVNSEIPPGAGLGSSSACCVAGAAAALGAITGINAQHDTVMKLAMNAEKTVFPGASGADTAASMLGGMIIYKKDTGYKRIQMNRDANFGLVVSDSEIKHSTEEMVSNVARVRDENMAGFESLCRKEDALVSDVLCILDAGAHANDDIHIAARLGRLASLNQKYLVEIGVSNHKIDGMVQLMDRITYGSKITGAGGGGCIIGFVDGPQVRSTGVGRYRQDVSAETTLQARSDEEKEEKGLSHVLPAPESSPTVRYGPKAGGSKYFAVEIDHKGLVVHTHKQAGP